MKITREMKIREVLALDEQKMLDTLMWLAPQFERLRHPKLRRAMSGRVSVKQAARIAGIPLTEMLYVLNLAIGENEADLARELAVSKAADLDHPKGDLPVRPREIVGVRDDSPNVTFVDLMPHADAKLDPMPAIARGLVSLNRRSDVLLIRHPFDPIPLRDMLTRKGFDSWAEERKEGLWYIYFYRPRQAMGTVAAVAHPVDVRTFAAAA